MEVQVVNRGNRDFAAFPISFALHPGDQLIFVQATPPGRLHAATVESRPRPTPDAPREDVLFSLKPFNRKKPYTFKLFVVIPPTSDAPGMLTIDSSEAVIFSRLPTLTELATQVARGMSLSVGPARITFLE
jgi:hypothetical protein